MSRSPVTRATPLSRRIWSMRLAPSRNKDPGPQVQETSASISSPSDSISYSARRSEEWLLPQPGCKCCQRASIMLRLSCIAIALPPVVFSLRRFSLLANLPVGRYFGSILCALVFNEVR